MKTESTTCHFSFTSPQSSLERTMHRASASLTPCQNRRSRAKKAYQVDDDARVPLTARAKEYERIRDLKDSVAKDEKTA
eukprot:3121938-Rhodomonas_salina.1